MKLSKAMAQPRSTARRRRRLAAGGPWCQRGQAERLHLGEGLHNHEQDALVGAVGDHDGERPATTSAQLAALLAARSPASAAPDALVVAHMDADVIRLGRTCR